MHTQESIVDWTTAVGTVAAAFVGLIAAGVAIWIAIWSDKRMDQRLKAEREHADERVERERDLADERINQERRLNREREQLQTAAMVQVTQGCAGAGNLPQVVSTNVKNHSPIAIRHLQAKLRLSGSGSNPSLIDFMAKSPIIDVLSKWNEEAQFRTDELPPGAASGAYPVVRWIDYWGTCWENRSGVLKPIEESDPWLP